MKCTPARPAKRSRRPCGQDLPMAHTMEPMHRWAMSKTPDKKGHLLIDPETRWIVEKIFDLAIHGKGAASITRILIAKEKYLRRDLSTSSVTGLSPISMLVRQRKRLRMDDSAGQKHYER